MILNEDTPTSQDILCEALVLRGWNWSIFPTDSNKTPTVKWKSLQRRRPTDRELSRMFRGPNVRGIAVITGDASDGFANRDYDLPEAYMEWAADHPRLAAQCPTIRTRRGFRVCFRTRRSMYRRFADGELIADHKHFVLMPPSRHPSGTAYEWVGGFPLGTSEFPLLDPITAGFVPANRPPIEKRSKATLDAKIPLRGDVPLSDAIRECVLRTLPYRAGERNAKLFVFARSLRDHVAQDAPPGLLYDAVQHWWQMALPSIGTKEFGVTLLDFRRAWADVRVPMCQSRPMLVMTQAAAEAATPHEKLVAACRALAEESGGVFYLGVRTAAEVIGASRCTAARLLTSLVASRFLETVSSGKPSAVKRMATEYRLGKSF